MEENYLEILNPPQREAVLKTEGPTMIIAGAGSGKTRVLTYRIAHLLKEKNVDPFSILSLTFTNKAAKEMRHRIEELVGTDARNLWMGTFHSVFSRILRSEADKLGYPSHFTIYDSDDSKSLIKNIVKYYGLDDKLYKPNVVLNRISSAKNRLVSWQEYTNNPIYLADDTENGKPEMGKIYKEYVKRCFKADAMDFDDLLFNTNVLFRDHVDVLNKYQQRFKYVMVDEFQDTNISQYLITKKLAAVRRNICVVGDDAQSIYAFRGADIQNILNFEKDYPELNIIKLEQNYRSSKTIVGAANSIIGKNKNQLRKSVWTDNDEGSLIDLIKATTDNEEGKLVASAIFESKNQDHYHNSDFAILYRTNSQSRALEEALRRNNIKYKIVGGLSFYQRKEIKDILGYVRFSVNQNDEQALRRIINTPKRGIGAASVEKLIVAAAENNADLWTALENATQILGGRAASAVNDFVTMIKSFKLTVAKKDAFEAASHIAKNSGLLKELYDDKTIEGRNRYENVQELLNGIKEFVDNPESEDKSMASFLQEIALLTDADNDKDEDKDYVTLMTIHSSKGLEFKNVFVVGMEEDLFPSQMMISSRQDLEEERRLFYVAITRAEKKLYMSYALTRYRFGRLKTCEPSRFLEEIDKDFLKMNLKFSAPSSPAGDYAKNFIGNTTQPVRKPVNQAVVHKPSADFKPSNTSKLAEGDKVEHPKFGFGKVTKIEIQGANKKAHITFEKAGEKTLLLSFAKLRIL
ncbi:MULTISPECIES: ATP-dependent helicase [Reichenbachiella]|uniref:DNA 3'-5' helicase n=1 Tax=Reichenbachiella agariperforans TaxID=156994 RepID=A0A1M6RDS0_REIAG|nr:MULTISPECIES: UvrD-helicase domain-containing protein [Reichenbachiella]RJE70582.1 ATP-dependent DNA helicase [Reichenbachiella sp. MSK19-1]SHK30641.1 DNA helicase-2 / ATP-dependent DNA helicase PcrA [Reichenbachiella agariperforans]